MEDEDRNISVEPTKDNIEKLLSREKINEVLGSDKGIKLLSIFGFDELDLYIKQQVPLGRSEQDVRKDIAMIIQNVASRRHDLDVICGFLDELSPEELKNLHVLYKSGNLQRKIDVGLERSEKSESIHNNAITGEAVERIIYQILSKEGLPVSTKHKGSDIEIWPIEEGWDGGRIFGLEPYQIEVKFTTTSRVRLSKKQADLAIQQEEKYILLVVKDDKHLKKDLLEYADKHLKEDLFEYDILDPKKNELEIKIISSSYVVENIFEMLKVIHDFFMRLNPTFGDIG